MQKLVRPYHPKPHKMLLIEIWNSDVILPVRGVLFKILQAFLYCSFPLSIPLNFSLQVKWSTLYYINLLLFDGYG